jgi:hypothetical protein
MKNLYKNYISKTEILIAEKTKAISNALKNARNINTAVAKKYDEEKKIFNELMKTLADSGLSDFFREFQIALDLDKNITEEMAFEGLLQNDGDIDLKIGILADFSATKKILQYIEDQREIEIENLENEKLHWGGNKQTEFAQLIYALFESGYIVDNDNIGKIKIVERMSKFLNFPLTKTWRDDVSSSIHDRNNDYEPEIFKIIQSGWATYRDCRLETKRKNKS